MLTGPVVSGAGHAALIVLAMLGLPWFGPREREAVRVTDVSFVSEAEFDAAVATQQAEPDPEAAPEPPAPEPAEATPAEAPDVSEAEPAPEPTDVVRGPGDLTPPPTLDDAEIAALAPDPAAPLAGGAPEFVPVVPRVVTVPPPAASEPQRPADAPKVAAAPTPPEPVTPPPPEPEPVVEPAPPEPLALTTSVRPKPRQVARPTPATAEPPPVVAQVEPEPAPEPEPAAEPEPAPETEPVAEPEPAPETAPDPERQAPPDTQQASILAAVQAAQEAEAAGATQPTAPSVTPATPSSLPSGPPITEGEREGLRLAVQACWNVPAGLRDAQELGVVLAAELGADGAVINSSIRLIQPNPAPDGRFQQAFDAGRRALIRCSPYTDLPREKYGQWRNIEVVFNPEGMVSW